MRLAIAVVSIAALVLGNASAADDRACVVVVVGAPGTPEYEHQFTAWADKWQAAAAKASAEFVRIGQDKTPSGADRDRLRGLLSATADGQEPLWLVLIGHGSHDSREAKFNLRGPDISDRELAEWLSAIKRPLVVLDCTSSSGPFLNRLSGANRVVVTATRSGHEESFAHFGEYLTDAIADPRADLDKDGQVSVLEAFLTASGRTAEYYRTHSRLASEHALLDDNGDKLGTPADWFRGTRAVKRAKDGAPVDGIRAHQIHLILSDRERQIPSEIRRHRDELERALAALRDEKSKLSEDEYYARVEPVMVELARIYGTLSARKETHKR